MVTSETKPTESQWLQRLVRRLLRLFSLVQDGDGIQDGELLRR
ncbi:hypothetical protein [Laspinema olomoucense]|nr:hypothetical protein [Laspinema sp. D3b]